MTGRVKTADVSGIPGLEPLADEVQRTGAPVLLQREGFDVAMIVPLSSDDRFAPRATPRPWTDAERAAALAILADLRETHAAMLRDRDGVPFAESWPIINEERDRRAEELG